MREIIDGRLVEGLPGTRLVQSAAQLAIAFHGQQQRYSGVSAYQGHLLPVAQQSLVVYDNYIPNHIATTQEREYIAAASLLHDLLEDTIATASCLDHLFGDFHPVTELVLAMSKPKDKAGEQQYFKEFSQKIKASSYPLSLQIIRIVDYVQNLETLECMPKHKQERKAQDGKQFILPCINSFLKQVGRTTHDLLYQQTAATINQYLPEDKGFATAIRLEIPTLSYQASTS